MKLMSCAHCGDFISPYREPRRPRFCHCNAFAVWWEDPRAGVLRVWARLGPCDRNVWVLGINNAFLTLPEPITAHDVRRVHDDTPDSYLFKRLGSPLIRIRPGETSDTAMAMDLPEPPSHLPSNESLRKKIVSDPDDEPSAGGP